VVTANIAAFVASDAAGNGNFASAEFSRTFDSTAPTVAMTSAAANPTKDSLIPVTVQFSENVIGFTIEDIVAANGTVSNFVAVDGDTYTFALTPSGQGAVTANIAASVATDDESNGNSAAAQFSRIFDSAAPTVTVEQASGQADPTNVSPVLFTVVFAEPVSGFASGDIVLAGTAGAAAATVTQVAPNNGTTYRVAVNGMTATGTIIVSVAAGAATDAAGNSSVASTSTDNTVTFVLNVLNVAPIASTQSATSENAGVVTILLTATDADGNGLTFSVVTGPTNGTLNTNAPVATCSASVPSTCTASINYTHNGSSTLSDTFTYKVNDGRADSEAVAVTITVEATEPTGLFDNVMVLPFLMNE
jgi:hypothetical protein